LYWLFLKSKMRLIGCIATDLGGHAGEPVMDWIHIYIQGVV